MTETISAFVIVDDEQRRHDLQTILEFIGETVIVADPGYWVEPLQNNEEIGLVPGSATITVSPMNSRMVWRS